MLTTVRDDVGRHDFIHAPCSQEMFGLQYGITEPHPNCLDNLSAGLASLGVHPPYIPTPFNAFMNTHIAADGHLTVRPPTSRAGDCLVLRAETDVALVISACPALACNGGRRKALGFEMIS